MHLARDPEPASLLVRALEAGGGLESCRDAQGRYLCLCACTAEQRLHFPQLAQCCTAEKADQCGIYTSYELTTRHLIELLQRLGRPVPTSLMGAPRALEARDEATLQHVLGPYLGPAWSQRARENGGRYHVCSAHLRALGLLAVDDPTSPPVQVDDDAGGRGDGAPIMTESSSARHLRRMMEKRLVVPAPPTSLSIRGYENYRTQLSVLALHRLDTFSDAELEGALQGFAMEDSPLSMREQVRALLKHRESGTSAASRRAVETLCQQITCLPPPHTAQGIAHLQDKVLERLSGIVT